MFKWLLGMGSKPRPPIVDKKKNFIFYYSKWVKQNLHLKRITLHAWLSIYEVENHKSFSRNMTNVIDRVNLTILCLSWHLMTIIGSNLLHTHCLCIQPRFVLLKYNANVILQTLRYWFSPSHLLENGNSQ